MPLVDELGLLILVLTMGAQITLRSFLVRYEKVIWFVSLFSIFGVVFYWIDLQYSIWQMSPVSKFLIPPYQNLSYFYYYVGKRLLMPPLFALLAAIILSRVAQRLNQRLNERFFEKEETRFFALGVFLTGYPGFLFYIVFILIFELLFSVYYHFFSSQKRAPLYFAWFPLAISAILIKNWLFPGNFLVAFNF